MSFHTLMHNTKMKGHSSFAVHPREMVNDGLERQGWVHGDVYSVYKPFTNADLFVNQGSE
jgi:hypothetical protein